MNKLLDEIKKSRDVRPSTLKIYENNLNSLSKDVINKPFRSRQFLLKQKDAVIAKLQEYNPSKRRSMIASILVAISPKGKNQPQNKNFSKVYKLYNAMLKDENKVYQNSIADNQKSDKDIANWVNWNEFLEKRDELGDELKCLGYTNYAKTIKNKSDRQRIIQHLVLSLYTYLPPRRLEYSNMILYPIGAYQQLGGEKDNRIYYVTNKGKAFIHYGKNATKSKTDNNIIFNVPRALYDIIKRYIKLFEIKNGELLLENALGRKYTPNGLGKEIKKTIMKSLFNKEGSVGILRKSFLSNQFGGEIGKQKELAHMMNHTTAVQQSVYVKV
jgi:hypothetical protein